MQKLKKPDVKHNKQNKKQEVEKKKKDKTARKQARIAEKKKSGLFVRTTGKQAGKSFLEYTSPDGVRYRTLTRGYKGHFSPASMYRCALVARWGNFTCSRQMSKKTRLC